MTVRRCRDDRGSTSLAVALLTPLLVILMFAAVQAALWGHARTEARATARRTAALVARSGVSVDGHVGKGGLRNPVHRCGVGSALRQGLHIDPDGSPAGLRDFRVTTYEIAHENRAQKLKAVNRGSNHPAPRYLNGHRTAGYINL